MKEIKDIKNSQFLKELSNEELTSLAEKMRNFIIDNVSKTGGHLSSNLGIVDLVIALLKVFDAEKDVILFDVGHQCYPYKILTGRAEGFTSLRQKDGLSGFQSLRESEYDKYEAGHSSTSISSGLGFAISRDLDEKDYHVISVIGDGSFSNGLAYEAINHLGDLQTKQIIILNDNQMSISKNVGAFHNFLDAIRSAKGYNAAKSETKDFLTKSKFGSWVFRGLDSAKTSFKKAYLKKGSMFEDLGIEYYGPINGHDFVELQQYLEIAKNETKPVILHVITQKGKGYSYAEEDDIGKYHGVGKFDVASGEIHSSTNLPSYSEIISSYVYNFARKDASIICITPGMCYGSKLEVIKEKLPLQYIDVGIAEEHALLVANTLALSGKKPFVFIYSTFLQRGYDQIVHDIARMKSNVTLCIDRAGFVPSDGVSHQGLFDIPMLMSIPNMVIAQPKNAKEAYDLVGTALNYDGPFAIRYPKDNLKYDYGRADTLPVGSWEEIAKGKDGVIITYGDFVNRAERIREKLSNDKIDLGIVNARFIKPLDEKLLNNLLKKYSQVFVYEESLKLGSLGSVIAMKAAEAFPKTKVHIYAADDTFFPHASREELIKEAGLDEDTIIKKIKVASK